MRSSANPDLLRFTGNEELNDVFSLYAQIYSETHPELKQWGTFNGVSILNSAETNAAIYFDPEVSLFGKQEERQKQGTLGKVIANHILDCATYFHVKNIPADDIPDELRICLAVCHEQSHWTSVVARVQSFKQFYRTYAESIRVDNHDSSRDDIRFNNVKNAVRENLGIEKNALEEAIAKNVFSHFSHSKIDISHFDSFNHDYFFYRVQESLKKFTDDKLVAVENIPCSQQNGHTCGDHTIANLFMFGMFNQVPEISDNENSVKSSDLRHLTNMISQDPESAKESAKIILSKNIPEGSTNTKKSKFKQINGQCSDAINQIASKIVTTLFEEFGNPVENLVSVARSGKVDKPLKELLNEAQPGNNCKPSPNSEKLFARLVSIFQGTDNELLENIPDEDKRIHGIVAGFIASDHAAELVHKSLVKAKSSEAFRIQKQQFDEYEKSIQERADKFADLCSKHETLRNELNSEIKKSEKIEQFLTKTDPSVNTENQTKDSNSEITSKNVEQEKQISSSELKQINRVKQRVNEICDSYIKHLNIRIADSNKFNDIMLKIDMENTNSDATIPLSTQLYLRLNKLKASRQSGSKNCNKNIKLRSNEKSMHRYEGYVKAQAVREIITNINGVNSQASLNKFHELLSQGKTTEILNMNRQSQEEKVLKILSVIGILAGIGIFTTFGLMMKRLHDTRGTSLNFFKPLTKNLQEDITKITTHLPKRLK